MILHVVAIALGAWLVYDLVKVVRKLPVPEKEKRIVGMWEMRDGEYVLCDSWETDDETGTSIDHVRRLNQVLETNSISVCE